MNGLSLKSLNSALCREIEFKFKLKDRIPIVFLDYDGTLVPIITNPNDSYLSQETFDILSNLKKFCEIGIISGRDLNDVKPRINLDGITYMGNHGFEIIDSSNNSFQQNQWLNFVSLFNQIEFELNSSLKNIDNIQIERKKYSISIHYRQLNNFDISKLEVIIDQNVSNYSSLKKINGKKIFEIVPNVNWNKGKALIFLLNKLNLKSNDIIPIYVGDDVTDETVFLSIRDIGVGIVVGDDDRLTFAKYSLKCHNDVKLFLKNLISILKENNF